MHAKPTDSNDGVELDHERLSSDLHIFNSYDINIPIHERLHDMIVHSQAQLKTGLTPERLVGFEAYPRYAQLLDMATNGLQPFTKPDFTPNQGRGDFRRDAQHQRLRHTIAQHVRKLQDAGRCLLLPADTLSDVAGLHVSALHVAVKAGDSKGRPCTDASHSGLNEGTDMEALTAHLGSFQLPQLRELARMLAAAEAQGHNLLHKTDVTSAFNCMLLSPEAALLQTVCVGDFILIPLVAGFGWSAAPAYYNVIADAIHWAHNGGVSDAQLDEWTIEQGRTPAQRAATRTNRSITYVDDSCGHSSTVSVDADMGDLQTVICQLLGAAAYNLKKTEGPSSTMTIIGWRCDMHAYTIRPSDKGQCKMYFWVFRGLQTTQHILLHDLQSAVGTLRWYSAVVPMASTFELQRALTAATRRHCHKQHPSRRTYVKLPPAALRELEWWRWLLTVNLQTPMLTAPVWHLAHQAGDREHVHAYTDACTSLGGGCYLPEHCQSQLLWSTTEKTLFGRGKDTDINGLEFVTAVCAVLANREYLRGKVVHLHVDNTAAVAWLNKMRTSQLFGQAWIRMLISVLLTYDIIIECEHIAGVLNIAADALSRFLTDQATKDLLASLPSQPLLSAASREIIWAMSSTPRSVEEYLTTLEELERVA